MEKLRALREHDNCAHIAFDDARKRFVHTDDGRAERGLTKLLAQTWPVALHESSTCARCNGRAKKLAALKRRCAGVRIGDIRPTKRTRKHFVGIGGENATMCRRIGDRAHGAAVDDDVARYVAGSEFASFAYDPCSVTLMAYVEQTLGLQAVATQMPIYSPTLGVATAMDLLCVDAASRTKLYLVEVKATRARGTPEAIGACYRASANTVDDIPMSRYAQHQLQLWAMYHAVRECGVALDGAYVLRTSPRRVFAYPLNDAIVDRDASLVARFNGVSRARRSAS